MIRCSKVAGGGGGGVLVDVSAREVNAPNAVIAVKAIVKRYLFMVLLLKMGF